VWDGSAIREYRNIQQCTTSLGNILLAEHKMLYKNDVNMLTFKDSHMELIHIMTCKNQIFKTRGHKGPWLAQLKKK